MLDKPSSQFYILDTLTTDTFIDKIVTFMCVFCPRCEILII